MPNYKILEGFELEGTTYEADSEVELSEDVAAPLIDEGKIVLVEEKKEEDEDDLDKEL